MRRKKAARLSTDGENCETKQTDFNGQATQSQCCRYAVRDLANPLSRFLRNTQFSRIRHIHRDLLQNQRLLRPKSFEGSVVLSFPSQKSPRTTTFQFC